MRWKKLRQAPLRLSLFVLLVFALLIITSAELWMTDKDALDAANAAYDRSLFGAVKSIAANISTDSGGLSVELPYRMFEFFELTASGQVHFRVATSDGLVELGSADLPAPPGPMTAGVPVFYDASYFGESVRVGAYLTPLAQSVTPSPAGMVLVQVAEGTQSRQDFTRRFVMRSALRDALILGLTLLTMAGAITISLRPLSRLAAHMRARRPDDLTPLQSEGLSDEIQPLVQAVNQHMQRTQALSQKQRQFVDDASHQLRTHLTTLHVQTDHAIGEADQAKVQLTLAALRTEIERATRTTNQLLSLARSDSVDLRWQHFDLADLVRDVTLSLMPQARKKAIDLGVSTQCPDTLALGDKDLLREALLNLLANAVAYTPQDGEVTVIPGASDTAWTLAVHDNGPGLSEAERNRLGERFMRSDRVPSAGSGLGLAIARSIAVKHGGTLRLMERPDGTPGLYAMIEWPKHTEGVTP